MGKKCRRSKVTSNVKLATTDGGYGSKFIHQAGTREQASSLCQPGISCDDKSPSSSHELTIASELPEVLPSKCTLSDSGNHLGFCGELESTTLNDPGVYIQGGLETSSHNSNKEAQKHVNCSENLPVPNPAHNIDEHKIEKSVHQLSNDVLCNETQALRQKLSELQKQVDNLLEEKRIWLQKPCKENEPHLPQQLFSGELKGRFLKAQNLAEMYKKEMECMVIKYAQCEQKRMQLEQQVRQLELQHMHSTGIKNLNQPLLNTDSIRTISKHDREQSSAECTDTVNRINTNSKLCSSESTCEELQKHLLSTREQLSKLLKTQSTDKSHIQDLETKLSNVHGLLQLERKKSTTQTESLNNLNKSLETALRQAKEAERLREREAEWLCAKFTMNEMTNTLSIVKNENEKYKQKVEELEKLKVNYQIAQAQIEELTNKLVKLDELEVELNACRSHDQQLSEFTRRLTETNADQQAEQLIKLQELESQIHVWREKECNWTEELDKCKLRETELNTKLLDLMSQCEFMTTQLMDLQSSETQLKMQFKLEKEHSLTVHKRDVARLKDMTREITRLHQQLKLVSSEQDAFSVNFQEADILLNSSLNSPAFSENQIQLEQPSDRVRDIVSRSTSPLKYSLCEHNDTYSSNGELNCITPKGFNESVLIEKIHCLQKSRGSLTDQLESSESRCHQYLEELEKKDNVIQHLLQLIRDRPMEFESNHELSNPILDSLHSVSSSTVGSKKHSKVIGELDHNFQNVLTNLIMKNITLKENLSIMGEEISNLTLNNQQLLGRICPRCGIVP